MDFLQWMERMSVNVDVLDDDHKKLIDLINRTHALVERGGDRDQLSAILKELINYTEYHFRREEDMMQAVDYPDFESHRNVHSLLVAKVREYEKQLHNNFDSFDPMILLEFLSRWLMKHILHEDRKYKPYLSGEITSDNATAG